MGLHIQSNKLKTINSQSLIGESNLNLVQKINFSGVELTPNIEGELTINMDSYIKTVNGNAPDTRGDVVIDSIKTSGSIENLKFWVGTQNEYEMLEDLDDSTFYIQTNEMD